jgi:lipopolysaccharide export system permease protein
MKVSTKFLFKELLKINLFILPMTFIFFNVIDFFERYSTFSIYKKPFIIFLEYLFWKGIVNFYQVFPYLLAFSTILTMFYLTRTKELLALLSLGYSRRTVYKILLLSVFLFNFFFGILLNYISPLAFQNAVDVWERKVLGKKKELVFLKKKLFFEGQNYFLIAQPLEPNAEYLGDVLYLTIDLKGEIEEIIWADTMLYSNGSWILEKLVVQKRSENFVPKKFDKQERSLPFNPSTLVVTEKTLKFLTIKELYQRLQFLSKVGKSTKEVILEFLFRFYYLFAGFFISLWCIHIYLKFYSPVNQTTAIGSSLIVYIFISLTTLMIFSFILKTTLISIVSLILLTLSSIFLLLKG